LRDFFEVDARYIVLATLKQLAAKGDVSSDIVARAIVDLKIDSGKLNPHVD
jgi:pyruvate dehydrogenase E1 component